LNGNLSLSLNPLRLALTASVLACTWAAGQPMVTDRPGFANSTAVVPAGRLQLESGYQYDKSPGSYRHSLGQLQVRVPVSGRMELGLGVNSHLNGATAGVSESGYGGSSLGLKAKLFSPGPDEAGRLAALTAVFSTSLPTGSRAFRPDHLEPSAMVVADLSLGGRATLTPFASYTRASSQAGQTDRVGAGLSLGATLSGQAACFIQYFELREGGASGQDTHWLCGGVTLLASDNLQFDWHAGLTLGRPLKTYFTGVGISTRFAVR